MTQTRALRVAFLGNDAWSVPSLAAIAGSQHQVVEVVTAEPKPAGRGSHLTPTLVAVEAERLGLPLLQTPTVKRGPGSEELSAAAPDVLAVVAYGEILPVTVLRIPTIAPVNLHFSLLPELRGAAPVQTALLAGLDRTGVTTIVMEQGMDTGPVILQREVPILPEDDAGSLGARLAEVGAEVLVWTLDLLAAAPVASTPQDPSRATFAPKLRPEDRVLDWSNRAVDLVNLVRALSPEPAAATTFRGDRLKVFRAETAEALGEPGRVVEVSKRGIVVATVEGGVRPLVVAPAGRRVMRIEDFMNGFRPEVGERLG